MEFFIVENISLFCKAFKYAEIAYNLWKINTTIIPQFKQYSKHHIIYISEFQTIDSDFIQITITEL